MFTCNKHNRISLNISFALLVSKYELSIFRPAFLAVLSCMCAQAIAAPIAVPNADFSLAANDGSIGGGLLGGSGLQPIGSGPWSGTSVGVLGLLAPPSLTIGPDQASISGLAVQVLGIANEGAFKQTLGTQWAPLKHYVLEADVSASTTLLGIDALTGGNVGLALESGTLTLSSSQSSAQISLTGQASNSYHIAVGYDSHATDSGDIGLTLFSNPTGILSAALDSTVNFGHIALTAAPIPALAANAIAPASGTPQVATVHTAFSAPLVVRVQDAEGDPLLGVTVTFTAPASGPSAMLSSATVLTDIAGRATVTGAANGFDGSYSVMASVSGVSQQATFNLTNSGAGQPTVTGVASGDNNQSATTGNPFACLLAVQVINGSAPAAGATVVFSSPLIGASAILNDGTNSGNMLAETTDANGVAKVSATANASPGFYHVTATAMALQSGPLIPPMPLATYPLTNLAAGDRVYSDGFETTPAQCGSF